MANTLTNILPKLLARGLLALREQAILPQLVNQDYGTEAAQKGATIDIPVSVAQSASDVVPGPTPPTPADTTPSLVQINLNNWKKTNFHLTDKEILEIERRDHFIPLQASEAVRALANAVNEDIHAEYLGVYGAVGTAGTTPFASDATAVVDARKLLNQQLAPRAMRRLVLDFDAEANYLALAQISDAERVGSPVPKMDGEIGRKFGFDTYTDNAVVTHTAGTASGATTDTTGYAIGLKTVGLASAGTGSILIGDIITFAGDEQQYVVTSGDADVSGGGSISFEPGLKVAIETSAHAITVVATHVVNLAFHRDAFAFASRPLLEVRAGLPSDSQMVQATDPVSQISLRLDIGRQYKQYTWEYDVLWGAKIIRPEYAVRLLG